MTTPSAGGGSAHLAACLLPVTIAIHQHLEAHVGTVLADPPQIHQVMNLCINAEHAMRRRGEVLGRSR